jgi:hypothetical protein
MPIQPYALGGTKDTTPTLAPIIRPQSTDQPTYLIIDYVALNGPLRYEDCGPVLVATFDYLTFYAANQADSPPLPCSATKFSTHTTARRISSAPAPTTSGAEAGYGGQH